MPRSQESSQSSLSVENINPEINSDFEENLHFRKAISMKLFKDQTSHYFRNQKNKQSHTHREFNSKVRAKTGRNR